MESKEIEDLLKIIKGSISFFLTQELTENGKMYEAEKITINRLLDITEARVNVARMILKEGLDNDKFKQ